MKLWHPRWDAAILAALSVVMLLLIVFVMVSYG